MRFAYADPPYPGQARRHYGNDPQCAEVDHIELIGVHLANYDGWALSTNSTSLRLILPYCPCDIRVMAWVKPFCSFKPNVNPAYAWEPVIVWGGRKIGRDIPTIRDWVSAPITLRKGVHGAKPEAFCFWLFGVLGMTSNDSFTDMFPGSGAVTNAWMKYCIQGEITDSRHALGKEG